MKKKKKKAKEIIQMRIKEKVKEIERGKDKLNKEFLKETQIILAYLKNEGEELKSFKGDLDSLLNGDLSVKIVREQRMEKKINSMIKEAEELKR
mgnify:CR=1 FL=1